MSLSPFFQGWSSGYLKPAFWGWESSESLANTLTGVCRIVHAPTQVWKVVQASFIPQVILDTSISKVVNTPFIPRFVISEAISKTVRSTSTGKAVKDERISRVQVPARSVGKVVMGSGIPKVQHGGQIYKVVVQTGQGKVVR